MKILVKSAEVKKNLKLNVEFNIGMENENSIREQNKVLKIQNLF